MKIPPEISRHLIMSEAPIRRAAHQYFKTTCNHLVDELKVCGGQARIDLAVLSNDTIHGVELKSDGDRLHRLPHQMMVYSRAMHRVTIISGFKHMYDVLEMVPRWWGVLSAEYNDSGAVIIDTVRDGQQNPSVDKCALLQFLNKSQLESILVPSAPHASTKRLGRHELVETVSDQLSKREISRYVTSAILNYNVC